MRFALTLQSMSAIALMVFATACARDDRQSGQVPATTERDESAADEPAIPDSVHLTSAAIAEAGITTWKIQPVDLEHRLSLNGTVGYNENRLLHVAANIRGRVASIPVDLGARVRRGDPLIEIESVEMGRAREELVRALADLLVASRAYERARSLVAAKAISVGELQVREAEYLSKKAVAESTERTLHLYGEDSDLIDGLKAASLEGDPAPAVPNSASLTIRAPFEGRIVDRKATPGALFEALEPLMTLADLSSVWVFFQAYEKDIALISEGLSVLIRTEAYPQASFRGRVDFIGSVVDGGSRTVRVRATVENQDERLRPGMFVKSQIEIPTPPEEAHATLAVPQSALQTLEGRLTVFVLTAEGTFVRRAVETGHTFEGFTEILKGVKPGEEVVTEGSFVLKSEFARATLVDED